MNKILRNTIKCNHCGEICNSLHRHDFSVCKCNPWKVAADGGQDYLRRCGNQEDYTEMFISLHSPFEQIREYLHIKDFSEKQIDKLIKKNLDIDYNVLLIEEKLYRAELEYET